jgi:hypothetical protein
MAVPGPHGPAGMTIAASPVQNWQDIRGHLHMGLERSGRDDGRIGSLGLHELGNQEDGRQYSYEYLHPDHVHRKLSLSLRQLAHRTANRAVCPQFSFRKKYKFNLFYRFHRDSPIRFDST